jgi:hypothetical protein
LRPKTGSDSGANLHLHAAGLVEVTEKRLFEAARQGKPCPRCLPALEDDDVLKIVNAARPQGYAAPSPHDVIGSAYFADSGPGSNVTRKNSLDGLHEPVFQDTELRVGAKL